MKHILTAIFLLFITGLTFSIVFGCNKNNSKSFTLQRQASDNINVYIPLKPNEDWNSHRHTYGKDSILGHTIEYRLTTDSNDIYINYDVTILELNPKITSNLLSFLHGITLDWGFINEKDSVTPWTLEELIEEGLSQQQLIKKILDWEGENFKRQIPEIYEWGGSGFNLDIDIYPVFLNEDYITYEKYAYYYTGGAHGNYTSYLQTYDLKTGEIIELEDMIEPSKIDKFRKKVIEHMASSYPIYEDVGSVQQYLDTLNDWLGNVNLGVALGVTKKEDLNRITEQNYPLNDPGINETGLVMTYEKYQLTPGVNGVPVIVLTYDEIRDCLKAPFNQYNTNFPEQLQEKDNKDYWGYGDWYSKEEKDSIRNSWGLADNGKPFPNDIYDQYVYRNGYLKKKYLQKDILGTWYGYGHLYDDLKTLTLNEDGSYELIREEALNQDKNGDMIYDYYSTISGKYIYEPLQNKITLLNFREKNKIEREEFIEYDHPEHEEFIVHEIKDSEMQLANEFGDLWPYFKMK